MADEGEREPFRTGRRAPRGVPLRHALRAGVQVLQDGTDPVAAGLRDVEEAAASKDEGGHACANGIQSRNSPAPRRKHVLIWGRCSRTSWETPDNVSFVFSP